MEVLNIGTMVEHIHKSNKMKISAGVIIVLGGEKLFICHPTSAKWYGTYSFPKGGLEEGETEVDAAIRELLEETSISVSRSKLSAKPLIVDYGDKNGVIYKKVYLYTLNINNVSEIGLDSEIVPKRKLQITEVDWAGFVSKEEASRRLFHRFIHILDKI